MKAGDHAYLKGTLYPLDLELQADVSNQSGCWELELDSLKEQYAVLPVKPFLQPPAYSFLGPSMLSTTTIVHIYTQAYVQFYHILFEMNKGRHDNVLLCWTVGTYCAD